MVVFACNACGESLKKNQVENHYQRKCRNCNVLSCLDCGKDFWGTDYEQHTKCISEEEKYSGKNFVPKPGSNKNEIKQQQWLQQVQEAVDKCRANPRLKAVLIRLKDQPNVPRKKNKFVNFLSNGFNVRDPNLAGQVWDMLMENTENKKQESNQSEVNGSNKSENNSADSVKTAESGVKSGAKCNDTNSVETNQVSENSTEAESKKLSKREKKEERRKKLHKAEKKDKNTNEVDENAQENGISEKISKKKSKRKDENIDSKKSKKRKREEEEEVEEEEVEDNTENQSGSDEDTEQPAKKKFKTKFNWNEIIVEVLQTKGPEMKTKKLRKKVLGEYLSQGCTEKSEEKLWARFEKKLKKIPEVKVIGDKVKLKNAS